jgi:hypothetical protein
MSFSKIRENAFFTVFFGSLFLFFLWPLIILVKTFSLGDYHTQFYPWSFDYARQIAHGRLPFWTDLMTNGFPMVAEGQVGPYYLPHLVTYFLLPFRAAYTWSIPAHILIGGIGAYAFARKSGLAKEGAALAAVVFSFSSAYGGCFYTTGTLRVLTWLPWSLLLLERSVDRETSWFTTAGLLAAATGLMWTAGFPQIALYAEFYLFLYALLRFRFALRPIGVFAAASAAGAVLAAPQILPTLELASVSIRAGQGADFALWGSVPPPAAVSLLFPEWGKLARVSFYIGVVPFFLAAAACALPKRAQEKTHLFLAAFFFLLAIGKYNPIFAFLVSKISAPAMRNPSKFLFFTSVSLGFAAGWALDQLRAGTDERAVKRLKAIFVTLAFLTAVVPGIAGIALRVFEAPVSSELHALAERTFQGKKDPTHDLAYYHMLVDATLAKTKAVLSYTHLWTAVAALLAVAAAAVLLWSMGNSGRRARMPVFLAILVVVDLALFGHYLGTGFVGNVGPFPRERDLLAVHLAEKLRAEDGLLAEFVFDPSKEVYEPSFSMLYSLPHAGGYSPLLLKRYYELSKDFGFVDASLGRHPYSTGTWRAQRGALDALGVSHVLSDVPLDLDGFKVEEKLSGRYLYRNVSAVPPVYAVYRWKVLPDKAERLAYLKGPTFKPALEAVVEEPLPGGTDGSALDTRWLGTERRGMKTVARAELAADAVVVFRTAYYPRWRASVDGHPAKIFPVNHAFIGVSVPKGLHDISITYDDAPHVLAQRASIIGWALIFVAVCWPLLRRGKA